MGYSMKNKAYRFTKVVIPQPGKLGSILAKFIMNCIY